MKDYTRSHQILLRVKARHLYPDARSISHLTPRAYCVATPAPHMAVFAVPPCDREPQVVKDKFSVVQNETASGVVAGEWYGLAYIQRRGCGDMCVIHRYGS